MFWNKMFGKPNRLLVLFTKEVKAHLTPAGVNFRIDAGVKRTYIALSKHL